MNVYDFDKTILNRDSTGLFLLWCAKRYPRARRHILRALVLAVRVPMKKQSLRDWKQYLYRFLRYIPDLHREVDAFWKENIARVYPWYRQAHGADDLVISASPEFLIRPACDLLGIPHVIASRVDPATGVYTGENCSGAEKLRRFREEYPDAAADTFCSDSLKDAPMAAIAKKAYRIRRGRVCPWFGDK